MARITFGFSMLTDDKVELLQSFLGSLPTEVASRLAAAVELDRLADGKALPHTLLLEGLRPVLRTNAARRRTPTPLRLFCQPFEDLLVNTPRPEKQKARILRLHVMPVWHWVSQHVLPAEVRLYASDIRQLALRGAFDDAMKRAELFWPLIGKAMAAALQKDHAAAVKILGGELAAADAADMALMLEVGTAMLTVQGLLPKPTPVLTEELLWGLRNIYDSVVQMNGDACPYVSVVAMRRLAKPWEALKLALSVARQSNDTLIASTDMGIAGDVLFADMEDARAALTALRHPVFEVDTLLGHLAAFTNLSSAIVKEVEILRSGRWGQRLLKDRAAVSEIMNTFMERAPKEIAAGLPTYKAGYSGGPRVPDFRHPVPPDKTERALRYARVLWGTRLYAIPGSFGAKHKDAVDEACAYVRSYTEDLLKELRSTEGEKREIVEAQFQLTMELTGLLFDEGELEFLRRRGKAAGARNVAA